MGHYLKRAINFFGYKKGYCIAHNMEKILRRKRKISMVTDFVRQSSIELCSEEISKEDIKGNVAELGVYRGDFAAIINQLFPDRKLYLFDTFEGFSSQDIDIEEQNQYSTYKQDFSDTSVELVLSKMTYPDNCVVKKGYFPETAADVNDNFVFVSIDSDLYNPIYSGLEYFYPKMVKGGYIFVHDFNNMRYTGVRKALVKYCKENEIPYFPLSDSSGSAIIMK